MSRADNPATARLTQSKWFWPIAVSVLAWLVVFGAAVAVTLILPQSFCSTCRVRVEQEKADAASASEPIRPGVAASPLIRTECEIIRSEKVLIRAIHEIGLDQSWGRRYGKGTPLTTNETLGILKGRLDVRPVPSTSLIEIRVYSDSRQEAADIANNVAWSYRSLARQPGRAPGNLVVEIVESAIPALRPARPNIPLNALLGAFLGFLCAIGAGSLTLLVQTLFRPRKGSSDLPDSEARLLLDRRIVMAVTFGTLVGALCGIGFGAAFPLGLLLGPAFGVVIRAGVGLVVVGAGPRSIPLPPPNLAESKLLGNLKRW